MHDLDHLLDPAAGAVPPVDASTVEADLGRGRRALRRHRATRVASPVLGALLIGAVGYGVVVGDAPETELPVAGDVAEDSADQAPVTGDITEVQLVSFADEVAGYEVAAVPEGWEVQGATPYHLTIAPVGAEDADPSSFKDKLVVMLRSADDTSAPVGEPVTVGDGIGYLRTTEPGRDGRTATVTVLTYTDQGGSDVQVQVPPSLAWGAEQITAFAEGVVVTGDAEASVG